MLESQATAEKQALFDYLDAQPDIQKRLSEVDETAFARSWGALPPPPTRKIWMYWHQGWDSAPDIVDLCGRSWATMNPDYDVHFLSAKTVEHYLDQPCPVSRFGNLATHSDRLRTKLLRRHGGVWADATLFCSQPISPFAAMLSQLSQIFYFSHPGPDRLISSWFAISTAQADFINLLDDVFDKYFLSLEADNIWIHHYFVYHYTIEYLFKRSNIKKLREFMPVIGISGASHIMHRLRLNDVGRDEDPITDAQLRIIDRSLSLYPMHKLTWKGCVQTGAARARALIARLEQRLPQP